MSKNFSQVEIVNFLLEHNEHFSVELSIEDAAAVLAKMDKYNDIPRNINNLPSVIAKQIGGIAFKGENPNNGTFGNIKISIGNEYSLCMHVRSVTAYRPGDTPEKQKAILEALGRKYKANEVTVTMQPGSVLARFWWD